MAQDFLDSFFENKEKETIKEEQPVLDNEKKESNEAVASGDKIKTGESQDLDEWGIVKEKFKTPDEFKSYYEESDRIRKDYFEIEKMLLETQDPMQYFASEESAKREQLLKKRGDIPYEVADRIVRADLKSMKPQDVLELEVLLSTPEIQGGIEGAREYVKEKYGLDDEEEASRVVKNKMIIDAKKASENIEAIRADLKAPEKRDYKAQFDARKEEYAKQAKELEAAWTNSYENVKSRVGDFTVTEKGEDGKDITLFSYKVEPEYLEKSKEELVRVMVRNGINPNSEEALKFAEMEMRVAYLSQNWDKMIKAAYRQAKSAAVAEQQRSDAGMKPVEGTDVQVKSNNNPSAEQIARSFGF